MDCKHPEFYQNSTWEVQNGETTDRRNSLTLSCMALLCSSWATAEKATLPKEGLLGFRLDPVMVSGNTNLHFIDDFGKTHTYDRSYSASGAEFELRFWVFSVEGEVELGKADAITLDGRSYALDSCARYEREAGLGKLIIQVAPNMKIAPFYGYQIISCRPEEQRNTQLFY